MTKNNFVMRGIVPLLSVGILLYLGQHYYLVNGQVDWFRLAMVVGIPMGIPYMFIAIPMRWDIGGLVGMVALCVMIGGILGSVVAAFLVIRGMIYLVCYPISCFIGEKTT